MSNRTIFPYRDKNDELRVKIEAPGIDDLSAPLDDPLAFIRQLAAMSDEIEVTDNDDGSVTLSIPPGA